MVSSFEFVDEAKFTVSKGRSGRLQVVHNDQETEKTLMPPPPPVLFAPATNSS